MKEGIKTKLGRRDERFGTPSDPLACRSLGWYAVGAMKLRGFPLLVVLVLFTVTFANSPAQTKTLVVPREAVEGFGDFFANIFPSQDGNPVQQVYSAGEFADVPADSIWITGIALRLNDPNGSVDATAYVTLTMGVFEGPMTDLTAEMDQSLRKGLVVLDGRIRLFAKAPNGPAEFNLKLPFNRPFYYDRRRGQLVLRFAGGEPSTGGQSCDAHRVSPDRGLYLIRFSNGMPGGAYELVATEFSYTIPPQIERIRKVANLIEIDLEPSGSRERVRIERASRVNGSYAVEPDVELSALSGGKMRASLPLHSENRFYRILLE
jgi:hypothetical protein